MKRANADTSSIVMSLMLYYVSNGRHFRLFPVCFTTAAILYLNMFYFSWFININLNLIRLKFLREMMFAYFNMALDQIVSFSASFLAAFYIILFLTEATNV